MTPEKQIELIRKVDAINYLFLLLTLLEDIGEDANASDTEYN